MQVHITSPSYLKIDPGFPSLRMLKLPPNPVQTSVLEQTRPGLVKAKGNIVFRTLIPQGEHPGIIANTRFGTRLAADRYLFDFRSEIRGQIYGTYQRGANDNLVTNRQLLENRQPIIGHPLILHRATDRHMLVPCTPVPGQTLGQPVDTLGKNIKCRSRRKRIISHASRRQTSASASRKSDVKQVNTISPAEIFHRPSRLRRTGRLKAVVFATCPPSFCQAASWR